MEKKELISGGDTIDTYASDQQEMLILSFRDVISSDRGRKKDTMPGKGNICCRMSAHIMRILEEKGIATDFVEELGATELAVRKTDPIPLTVAVRNFSAGSFSTRFGTAEGKKLKTAVVEFVWQNTALSCPFLNGYDAIALDLISEDEIEKVVRLSLKINTILVDYLKGIGVDLIDLKLRFGKRNGEPVLSGEISPDTCRLWDTTTHERLDKDRFRRDLGNVMDAYEEVYRRLGI